MESISVFYHSRPQSYFIGRTLMLSDMTIISLKREAWDLDPEPVCLNPLL